MKKLIAVFCIIFTGSLLNGNLVISGTDSFNQNDSLRTKKGFNNSPGSEIKIVFNESRLAPANVRMVFNELLKQYLLVKDALVYNNSFNAKINTLTLIDDMKSKTKDFDVLNKDDRWIFFISNYDKIRNKAESVTFISEQRFLFNEITNGLINFIKQFGLYDKTVYLMECKTDSAIGNAFWFSDSKNKKNPYLGMINDTVCAKVKEVWEFK